MLASASPLARAFAVVGALVFVASLLIGGWFIVSLGTAPAEGALLPGVIINTLLFGAFALHHSVLAREPIKARIARMVSPALERPTYVWVASLLFIAVCLAWRPVAGTLYHLNGYWILLTSAFQLTGLALTIDAARRVDVLVLAGLRPEPTRVGDLVAAGSYRLVRHPIYLGWVLLVWADSAMTVGRLLFAIISTAYLVLAVPFEERSLRRRFPSYDAYARQVRWRILPWVY